MNNVMEHEDEKEFAELVKFFDQIKKDPRGLEQQVHPGKDELAVDNVKNPGTPTQYTVYGPGFKPVTDTVKSLKPGCYDICKDNNGIYAIPALPPTGLLLELPEMRSDFVLSLVQQFWDSEKDYKEGNEFVIGGAAFKAGLMIYGPPGSGKSCTLKLVNRKLIENGGIVFYASEHPSTILSFLTDFSRIEPNRKCIIILEDIDSLIQRFGESGYLEMLDSSKSIDNVLFIATTNYPQRLDPRIYNRPGRFSHVVKIGMPTEAAREAYLKAILKNHRDVEKIVKETKDFTIDHLTALVNSCYREKKELDKEIKRLRSLFVMPKTDEYAKIGLSKSEWSE